MKRLLLFAAAALCLALPAACTDGPGGVATTPAAIADTTKADEFALGALELSYKGARLACEVLVDAGKIKGGDAVYFGQLNDTAKARLDLARRAYDAANSASLAAALIEAQAVVTELYQLADAKAKDAPNG